MVYFYNFNFLEVYTIFNKRDVIIKLSTMAMAFAYFVPFVGSWRLVGEAKLPNKMQK